MRPENENLDEDEQNVEPIPPSTPVIVKSYFKRPGFWAASGDMDCYAGRLLTVKKHIKGTSANSGPYVYHLEESDSWVFRHADLVPYSKIEGNPNEIYNKIPRDDV